MYNSEIGVGCSNASECNSGCSSSDLCIKKGDTLPSLRVSMTDCDGVVDLTDSNLALEASMWFKAKTKAALSNSQDTIQLADNVGFDTIMIGDVIVTNRSRNREIMLVTGINESSKSISVTRGYEDSQEQSWSKGTELKIFRFRNQTATIESVFEESQSLNGEISNDLVDTFLVFKWDSNHTAMPGCYLLEFKLFKVDPDTAEVEWIKSIPLSKEGYLINVLDSSDTQ